MNTFNDTHEKLIADLAGCYWDERLANIFGPADLYGGALASMRKGYIQQITDILLNPNYPGV